MRKLPLVESEAAHLHRVVDVADELLVLLRRVLPSRAVVDVEPILYGVDDVLFEEMRNLVGVMAENVRCDRRRRCCPEDVDGPTEELMGGHRSVLEEEEAEDVSVAHVHHDAMEKFFNVEGADESWVAEVSRWLLNGDQAVGDAGDAVVEARAVGGRSGVHAEATFRRLFRLRDDVHRQIPDGPEGLRRVAVIVDLLNHAGF